MEHLCSTKQYVRLGGHDRLIKSLCYTGPENKTCVWSVGILWKGLERWNKQTNTFKCKHVI